MYLRICVLWLLYVGNLYWDRKHSWHSSLTLNTSKTTCCVLRPWHDQRFHSCFGYMLVLKTGSNLKPSLVNSAANTHYLYPCITGISCWPTQLGWWLGKLLWWLWRPQICQPKLLIVSPVITFELRLTFWTFTRRGHHSFHHLHHW